MLHKYLITKSLLLAVVLIFAACADKEPDIKETTLPQVVLETDMGDIVVEVDPQNAPVTTSNFLKYVDENRFDPATFYRTVTMDNQPRNDIKIEVIQGGLGFADSAERLEPIAHETTKETGIIHKNGTISMARLDPGTASSEFFICIGDQPELDFGGQRNPDGQGFAAFGQVVEGMDVVKSIQQQPDSAQMLLSPVLIKSVRRKALR